VILVFHYDDREAIQDIMGHIQTSFPHLHSLLYVINPKGNDTIYDLDVRLFAGQDHLVEVIGGLQFRVGPKSFFQTNTGQALQLYRTVKEFAAMDGRGVLYDLYSGTGTIALYMAREAERVVGVETVEEAVQDARLNAQLNGIGNAAFITGDLSRMFDETFIAAHGRPDVIITDPPRSGMHPKVLDQLLRLSADRIVYVSCNPATQARDLAILSAGYDLDTIQPVDMFPQTHHVENVALLLRKEAKGTTQADRD